MKVALIHDYLNQYGGAERVLENLMEIFPNAPVYTLLYDKGKTLGRFEGKIKQTSFLDFPLARKKHRWFLPFMPLAAQTMTIDHDYDLVISDSAGYAKGISIKCNRHGNCNGPKHISYIHTPLRYAWEQEEYLTGVISNWQLATSKPLLNYLKRWDYKVAQRPDTLIANSQFIAGKVKKYYGREAKVIHPPVDTNKFYLETSHSEAKLKNLKRSFASAQDDGKGRYYLAVGRLLHYKRFDLVIDAFAKLGLPLKIVGSGQESTKLQEARNKQQATNIEFVPFVKNEDELRKLYNGAKALVFPQVEDFGLVAAEAQACGTPVIAYAAGGATEIVEDGKGGILFKEQTPESFIAAVRQFEKMGWDRREISDSARRFSKNAFRRQFMSIIKEHS